MCLFVFLFLFFLKLVFLVAIFCQDLQDLQDLQMKHLTKQKYFGHDCLEPKIQLFVIESFLSCFVVVVIVVVVLVFCFSFANTHLTIL